MKKNKSIIELLSKDQLLFNMVMYRIEQLMKEELDRTATETRLPREYKKDLDYFYNQTEEEANNHYKNIGKGN